MRVKGKSRKTYTTKNGWDDAIGEAEAKMKRFQALIKRLRGAIKIFREQKANGEPFPAGPRT